MLQDTPVNMSLTYYDKGDNNECIQRSHRAGAKDGMFFFITLMDRLVVEASYSFIIHLSDTC